MTSSAQRTRKPPFGSRFLTEQTDVWTQNAWDNVPPPPSHNITISESLARQRTHPVSEKEKEKCHDRPERFWDTFYKTNTTNFFRDRKWLHHEFPDLVDAMGQHKGDAVIVEIGCGTGSSIFPLLSKNLNPNLQIKAYDYSSQAIKFVQSNPIYQTANDPATAPPSVQGSISASTWDITSPHLPTNLPEGSADIIILVFVLSALRPEEWKMAVNNIHKILKPSGVLLLRDYGRHDLTQLRFKTGRLLEDNFYIRGDNTRVYFFELDELALLFTGSKAPESAHTSTVVATSESSEEGDDTLAAVADDDRPDFSSTEPSSDSPPPDGPQIHPVLLSSTHSHSRPMFSVDQLGVDRRLIVNRKRKVKMYRIWVQGVFRKN